MTALRHPRRKPAHPESVIQRAYIDACRRYPPARATYAIPNGGKRGKVEAAILKGEGVLAGMLDLHLPRACGECIGLWTEFKAGKNTTSAEQEKRIAELVELGHHVAVVWDDWMLAWEHLHRYLRGELTPGRVDIKPPKRQRNTLRNTLLELVDKQANSDFDLR